MQERLTVELEDLLGFISYGEIYPTKKFIRACKKLKVDHTVGVGWPVFEQDKLPFVGNNCSVWVDDNSEPQITIKSVYSDNLITVPLEEFQETNKNVLGILWIDRAFDLD